MQRLLRFFQVAAAALDHDFCPGANRWVYWMKHPLAPLIAAALVTLVCGFLVNPYAFLLFGGLLVVALLGTGWPLIAVRGLTAEAEFVSTRTRPGRPVTVRLRIRNRFPWPVWGLTVRKGFVQSRREDSGVALASLAGWAVTDFEWVFRPERRGVIPISRPEVDTAFPFGLIHASVPIEVQNELLVWPESVPLDAMPDAVEIHSREDHVTDRRTGDCGDIVGTRLFRDGDSLRRVHWAQTARHGRLIVTERQAPSMCAVRLQIDVTATNVDRPALEHVLAIGASLLESLHRQHAFVEVLLGPERFSVGASATDLRRVLDAFARIEPSTGDVSGRTCAFDRPSRLLSTIIVTTDRALQHHRGHHHVSRGERYVIVKTSRDVDAVEAAPGCSCHAWIEVPVGEPLEQTLPSRWRKACHVH